MNGLPAVDLHDLSARLAVDAVAIAIDADPATGGLVLITGRGRHTGGRSKLREAVIEALQERQEQGQLSFRPLGPGRIEVVLSEERVRAARPGMGLLFWLFVALLVAAAIATLVDRLP